MFTFTEEDHRYFEDSREIPSVTTVLNEWAEIEYGGKRFFHNTRTGTCVPGYVFMEARDRGTASHKILEFCLTGNGVDKDALDLSLHGRLKAIEDWVTDYQPEGVLVETPLRDTKLWYAGRLDFYGTCKRIKNLVLADGKTGEAGPVAEQTAAYENLVRIETKYKGLIDRYVLTIGDGEYTFQPCGKPTDFSIFKARLSLYHHDRRKS